MPTNRHDDPDYMALVPHTPREILDEWIALLAST